MKPKLLAIWALFAALAGAVAWLELGDGGHSDDDGHGHGKLKQGMLLPLPVEELGAVEIVHSGALHRFERDAAGVWYYHGVHQAVNDPAHGHITVPEGAQRIEAAFAALGRAKLEREFPVSDGGAQYGLASPSMVLLFLRRGESQPVAQYAVGDVAADTVSRYVMQVGGRQGGTIPDYQIGNLLKLIDSFGQAPAPLPGLPSAPATFQR